MDTFKAMTSSTSALTFFILVKVDATTVIPQGDAYHLRGKVTSTITTPLSSCTICSAPLVHAQIEEQEPADASV